ncbi:unnamed protein product [Lota lota]
MSDHKQPSCPPSPSRPQNVKPRLEGGKSGRMSLMVRRSQSIGGEQVSTMRRMRERQEEECGRRRRSEAEAEAKHRHTKAPLHGHRKLSLQERRKSSVRNRRKSSSRDVRKHSSQHDGDVLDTECIVCFCSYDNVFKTPKVLACGHTFCLECLARINVSSTEITSLTCPVCRKSTQIPHGRDLPQLGNNLDVFRRLPPNMQQALSVRFKRSKGKLFLRKTAGPSLTLPKKKKPDGGVASERGLPLGLFQLENTAPAATVLDVGQPPNRVRGRLRRMFHSDRCYNAVVAAIITITVALMLVGVLAFVIVPSVVGQTPPHRPVNQTVIPAAGGPTP